MLVLARKKNESIVISNTTVTVVEIVGRDHQPVEGAIVRLGISAPAPSPPKDTGQPSAHLLHERTDPSDTI